MSEGSQLNERIWRCDCGAEVLGVSFYTWPTDSPEWFIEVYKMAGVPSLRWRLGQVWNLLLGRDVFIDAVSLDTDKTRQLIEFLQASIAAAGPCSNPEP